MDENQLKTKLRSVIDSDFSLIPEVVGYWSIRKQKVRIDYLARPLEHLVDTQFPPQWFGIEVKSFSNFHKHERGKKAQLIWQAVKCAQSEFTVNGETITPSFIALYIGNPTTGHQDTKGAYDWHVLKNLGIYARVLEFEIQQERWRLLGAGGTFFSQSKGPGNLKFKE